LNSVSGKQAAYHAIAEYYQSMISKESKEFGEQIARLRVGQLFYPLPPVATSSIVKLKANRKLGTVNKFRF